MVQLGFRASARRKPPQVLDIEGTSYPSQIRILDLERHPYQCTLLCGMRNARVTRTDLQNNQAATSPHQPTRDPDTILINITIYLKPTYCTVSNAHPALCIQPYPILTSQYCSQICFDWCIQQTAPYLKITLLVVSIY